MTPYKRNLFVLSVAVFLASLCWTQIIPFLPKYLTQLGVRSNLTAWSALVLGLQAVAGIVFMPLWGKVGDKYGRKPMIIRAGLCLSLIYIAMAFCSRPWHLALLRFLNGVLTGFLPGSFALIAVNTPNAKAGRYVAAAQSAAALGGVAGPVVGGILADTIGIRGTMWVSGIIVLLGTAAVLALVREPVRAGGAKNTSLLQDFILSGKDRVMRYVLINNWTNAIIASSVTSTLAIRLSQISPGLPGPIQGIIFAIPGILIGALSLRWVKLGERLTHRKAVSIGLLGAGAFYALMGFSSGMPMFVAAFILCRIFATALTPSLTTIVSKEVAADFRGRAFGILTSVGIMGELTAQLLVASIGQWCGLPALYVAIGIAVLASGAFHFSVVTRAQEAPTGVLTVKNVAE
jgi:DHA1 family multidrug resistance protein-like MFS transporter